MSLDSVVYTAQANVIGGREGRATANDGAIDLKLSTPKVLGGAGGDGTNPEQLFAAGYSACFMGALKLVASQQKVVIPADTTIEGIVGIGPVGQAFGIQVELKITVPTLDKALVEQLVATAHEVCPYSNATRGNIDVTLTIV
ncbi:organic hydroperoxide resistance protein [Marinomonas mediterranea]|jgi:peroxiredoxin, Ohr subfamily|uniref:Peroxiredoxin, Ohr subfamily n=1 Tax=Marinomonas mediterranea (strain ATCC 700492 / JCM 21426 / NBRC 103028 / MMB-1) TaxID=717774 RepID=F2JUW6_MARM1|nr:organic hydroperoxide resistance protein [Marinomonas mediterranea]ADZ91620.1 peroxiredoxin, Ohr subfamily [Marinomonas mediterranea MMB-1]WCN09579.1 Ohr family peroxiredoxin [Marinomonas mediterranea]WCN13664.1 Ohr family peroxiredoxin [Marinomonas mediterranea]WCN17721.1 Ohr family peroxiredoxin [Marinomonas mediterranea MMB-1]